MERKTTTLIYRDSKRCFLEFTSTIEVEPVKKFRLPEILSGRSTLPKKIISFDTIMKDANEKGIIPLSLVIVDTKGVFVDVVNLTEVTSNKIWYLPSLRMSYIEYIHEHTNPVDRPHIFIHNFLTRGFPKKHFVDSHFLFSIAQKQGVHIKKITILNDDNSIEKEMLFTEGLGAISIPNQESCKIFYHAEGGADDMSISLKTLIQHPQKTFPRERKQHLTLKELQECLGFFEVTIVGFQSDKKYGVQLIDVENFIEYEYTNRNSCFVYFLPLQAFERLHSVRLDHLFDRGYFPHVFLDASELLDASDASDEICEQKIHAPAQDSIDNKDYLKKVKAVHDYMYSFKPKTCSTCNNQWFVTDKQTPGNVSLDILNPQKNKLCFQYSNLAGDECDRCKKEKPPPGLPKMFSAANNMDFGPRFEEIDALTPFEEMLLAKVSCLVSVVTLTSTGYLSYQGHCVNFFQDSVQWFNTLPKRPSACEQVLICRKGAPAATKRMAMKVNRMRMGRALNKLMRVHNQYNNGQVRVDHEVLNSLPEDDVPSDAIIIEREMDDVINVQKDLFEQWLDMSKPFGNKLLEHLHTQKVELKDCFHFILESIQEANTGHSSFTTVQLKDFLEKFDIIEKENVENYDLLLGELTHASMVLEDTENQSPLQYGNVVHEEVEGQTKACTRTFDAMAKAVHGIPSIDDAVVVKEGAFKNNLGLVKSHNEDGSLSVLLKMAVYSGCCSQELVDGNLIEISTSQGSKLTGVVTSIEGNLHVVFEEVLLPFNNSSLHIQSVFGKPPQKFDLITLLTGDHKSKKACVKGRYENVYQVSLLNGENLQVHKNDLKLLTYHLEAHNESQNPPLPEPGITIPANSRIPMPLFEGPTRDENPIPERESNILSCAFPTLFQTGDGDIYAPRLRALDENGADALQAFTNHCLFWHDNRFSQHPRFLYCLFNRSLRYKLLKTKAFYMKNRKPTADDFLPEKKKKTIKEMRAYTAKIATTPGHKFELRKQLDEMCDQIDYMTANDEKVERISSKVQYEDYQSSDEEMSNDAETGTEGPPSFWNPTQEQVPNTKKTHNRPIEGVIPCYWATLTTAPFRASFSPFYINGHHETEKDVKVRRQLAIKNPNIVAYFSSLLLELVLKYLMVDMLDLEDYYCVFEWGSGGVLHLHCLLWNFKSERLDDFDLQEYSRKHRISKRKIRKLANFFNMHVSEWNLGKKDDGSWKYLPTDDANNPHPASISKQELDEIFDHFSNGEENFATPEGFAEEEAAQLRRLSFIVDLLEKVQQHNIHKPNPYGPPLPSQKCSKDKPKPKSGHPQRKSWETKNYCTKGYPKEFKEYGNENVFPVEFKEAIWKLNLERNDKTINNYNSIISLAILANMDIQPVITKDGVTIYTTKYIAKEDHPDIFRDFRNDSGNPGDPINNLHMSEVPAQRMNVPAEVTKHLMNQIKYSMISSPELHHHLLGLPSHFTSRKFPKISLQPDLNRILEPEEVRRGNANSENEQTVLVRQDEISTYEKRDTYEIPVISRINGINEETIKNMSLFLFHKHFFVRSKKICRKSKLPIIMFQPYISPRKKNNPKYEQYMRMTLLAYKAFKDRKEFTILTGDDLQSEFTRFFNSDECPFFVRKKHEKANREKKQKKQNELRSQDEIEDKQMASSSGDESDDIDEFDKGPLQTEKNANKETCQQSQNQRNEEQNEVHRRQPIGKFTEAYQEYGHMAPKGLEYEGVDLAPFDDDNDVLEEIKILSDQQDLIFNHSKDNWQSIFPDLMNESKKAEAILRSRIGVRETAVTMDPDCLDPTQTLLLETVLEWVKQCTACKKLNNPFPPLRLKLLGVAGTGKSRTIKTLVQEFNKKMEESDLPANERGRIVMCAPTGVAAFNIGCGAASVHKTFHIPVRGNFKDLTGDAQKELESAFENVWLVIMDEISMVGCEMFAKVNERLIQAKLDDNDVIAKAQKDQSLLKPIFGGIGMIVCGDFAQLVPIMQHSLMDNSRLPFTETSKQKDRFTNRGKELIEQFKVSIILTKQHRQTGGEYTKLCLKFRDGSFSTADHILLQKRNYDQLPLQEKVQLEEKGTRLVTTNKQAGNCNAKKLIATAKQYQHKIFRLEAFESGNKGKAVTTSENFNGLKSTLHLTIGSRVMLTSNIWVEAGLINGAQGIVKDIVFHTEEDEEPFPNYVLVHLDDYKGPQFFEDTDKINWVPIFPLIRQHQFNRAIERQQLPLRLSSAMTGHKVQGLSLYQGVIVQYPTLQESKKDPMDTWGLNYCILTRVPDLSKIAFINLPDYRRHMKLYQKSKGKDFFKMFLNFNRRSFAEFEYFVKVAANMSLTILAAREQKVAISKLLDFHSLYNETQTNLSHSPSMPPSSPSSPPPPSPPPPPPPPPRPPPSCHEQSATEKTYSMAESHIILEPEVQQIDVAACMLPRFENPSNNCWFNSVIQVILHALKNQGDAIDLRELIPLTQNYLQYGNALIQAIRKFNNPGTYNVNSICDRRRKLSVKQIMLMAMGNSDPQELHQQHDAAQCIQKLLEICPDLSFLWHQTEERIVCNDCNSSHAVETSNSVAPVQIPHLTRQRTFSAENAIIQHFQSIESGIERRCEECHSNSSSKAVRLLRPPNFMILQFKRFMVKYLRNRLTSYKLNTEAEHFSFVNINTLQGIFRYEVIASIQHVGLQMQQGHYMSYVKRNGTWFQCNDERITNLGQETSDPIRNAYLLLLKLCTD